MNKQLTIISFLLVLVLNSGPSFAKLCPGAGSHCGKGGGDTGINAQTNTSTNGNPTNDQATTQIIQQSGNSTNNIVNDAVNNNPVVVPPPPPPPPPPPVDPCVLDPVACGP